MQRADTDVVVLGALRRALSTMILIHAGQVEVFNTGFVIDLSADIQRLRMAVALLELQTEAMH